MFVIGPREVLTLLAADGPTEWLSGVRWPLHRVLVELSKAAAANGSSLPYATISTRPDPEVATAVLGADAALVGLAESGVLMLTGEGLTTRWSVVTDQLVEARRDLMRLGPCDADLVYRAGRRWAALAATSLKNWRTASLSCGSTVPFTTPNRRQVMLSGR